MSELIYVLSHAAQKVQIHLVLFPQTKFGKYKKQLKRNKT